jgi:hypothetical protein
VAEEFSPDVVEPQSWKLKGVGQYGSDVDVVSLAAYRELAQRCGNAEDACLMWARKAIELEGDRAPSPMSEEIVQRIVDALRLPVSAVD